MPVNKYDDGLEIHGVFYMPKRKCRKKCVDRTGLLKHTSVIDCLYCRQPRKHFMVCVNLFTLLLLSLLVLNICKMHRGAGWSPAIRVTSAEWNKGLSAILDVEACSKPTLQGRFADYQERGAGMSLPLILCGNIYQGDSCSQCTEALDSITGTWCFVVFPMGGSCFLFWYLVTGQKLH